MNFRHEENLTQDHKLKRRWMLLMKRIQFLENYLVLSFLLTMFYNIMNFMDANWMQHGYILFHIPQDIKNFYANNSALHI